MELILSLLPLLLLSLVSLWFQRWAYKQVLATLERENSQLRSERRALLEKWLGRIPDVAEAPALVATPPDTGSGVAPLGARGVRSRDIIRRVVAGMKQRFEQRRVNVPEVNDHATQ